MRLMSMDLRDIEYFTVVAQHGMVIGSGSAGNIDVSYLADSVVLFRYFEASGSIRRAIGALKKRTGAHEVMLRELRVDDTGLVIGDPLTEFHGIMTGVPEYRGATAMLEHQS